MSDTLDLFGEKEILKSESLYVCIDDLPGNEMLIGPDPDARFKESVRNLLVLEPISVVQTTEPPLEVIDGRRRIKALRECRESWINERRKLEHKIENTLDGDVAQVDLNRRLNTINIKINITESIKANVYPIGTKVAGLLSVVHNECRDNNPASELIAIENMLRKFVTEQGKSHDEALGIISIATGKTKSQLKSLLKLNKLIPELKDAFIIGSIKASTAREICKFNTEQQRKLLDILNTNNKLTLKDVKGYKKIQRDNSADQLFFENIQGMDDVSLVKNESQVISEQLMHNLSEAKRMSMLLGRTVLTDRIDSMLDEIEHLDEVPF